MLKNQTLIKQKVVILGSTGSIGCNALKVLNQHKDRYDVYGLVAGQQHELLFEQILVNKPRFAALADPNAASKLNTLLSEHFKQHPDNVFPIEILSGESEICQLVKDIEVDQVIAAIVGGVGLVPTIAAVRAGKRILLANKESLVMCGKLFMQEAKRSNATILPLDSEHNAIFQALPAALQSTIGHCNLAKYGVQSLILTGSGGPFLNKPLADFHLISVEEAVAHPRWNMGDKISVDSATMMNKGLEYIEACHLFNASDDQMEIVLHPQSVIHSMVRYMDGSVIAQMGQASMMIPIAHALAYPQRMTSPAQHLDFFQLNELTFYLPEPARYPCLFLAKEAFRMGQSATTVLNAANEISVQAFLSKRINFIDIAIINSEMLAALQFSEPSDIDDVLSIDEQVRNVALSYIDKMSS